MFFYDCMVWCIYTHLVAGMDLGPLGVGTVG